MTAGATWVALFSDANHVPDRVLTGWLELLSDADQTRARQFRSPDRSRQFIAARQVLRELISLKFGEKGVIGVSPSGALYVEEVTTPAWCSISHSGHLVLVGCSLAGPTGVDIEQLRDRNYLKLAKEYFHAQEYNDLLQLPEQSRQRYFYNAWCGKEAEAKAAGRGLTMQGLTQKSCSDTLLLWELDNYSAAISHPLNSIPELFVCEVRSGDFSLRFTEACSSFLCTD